MGGFKSCLWVEDIDLTGGSAAVAAALAAGIRGGFVLDGTDSILAPKGEGLEIRGILSGTETAAIEGATLTIAGNPQSPISLGGTNTVPLHVFRQLGLCIPVGSRADLDFLGYDHGAACEEFCSVIFFDPNIDDPWDITPDPDFEETLVVSVISAARVAVTQSGHADICGRDQAYADGQPEIPDRKGIDIYVLEIHVRDGAGYSGVGLMSPSVEGKPVCNLDFPCLATTTEVYNMQEMFGGAFHCKADEPFDIYGYGVGTTAIAEVTLVLGVSGL